METVCINTSKYTLSNDQCLSSLSKSDLHAGHKCSFNKATLEIEIHIGFRSIFVRVEFLSLLITPKNITMILQILSHTHKHY
ncbi:hypothetical protein BpHYR1_038889 [Brachionus plicatilis]|uniref:Uncharacterized protein n=1 Tax=Brachionus plicatilis TaxID=10195 RepID=A0A3M7PKS0_BRAPC|nr:hypothetical protein BpHYR1_038889 [Brachionus plicatilis]